MDIKTYPEMNEKIPTLLRLDRDGDGNPDPMRDYAAQLIEEQAAQLAAAEAREARLREGLVHYARQNGNYYTPYGSPHFNDGGLARSLLEVEDVTNTAGGEGEK